MDSGGRIRVLYVWDADYPWDVRVEKICRALTRAGMDVHILARNRRAESAIQVLEEGTVHRMAAWPAALNDFSGFPAPINPRWLAHASHVAKEVHPHIVIGRDIPLALLAIHTARKLGVPVILDIAEHYPEMVRAVRRAGRQRRFDVIVRNPTVLEVLEKRAVRAADHIVVVVEEMAERYRRMNVPASRLTVVSNLPPEERLRETSPHETRPDGSSITFVYLGLLEQPRGIGTFIDAIALCRERGHDVRASIIGSGREQSIFQEQAQRHHLGNDVVAFHGFVQYADALRIVAEADVGVIPHFANESWNNTIPNKLFDYMAAALPVLTSDARPAARVVTETGAGIVFHERDANSMADAMIRLTDSELRRNCGTAGRRAVVDRYHFEHDAARLVDVVEMLTAPRRTQT